MDPPFIQALIEEETRLTAELDKNPAFQQLKTVKNSLQSLRAAYFGASAPSDQSIKWWLLPTPSATKKTPATPRPNSTSSLVLAAAEKLMRQTDRRATSAEILAFAKQQGVVITNARPQNQVASILSHAAKFDNAGDSRGSGYGLREWTDQPSPQASGQADVHANVERHQEPVSVLPHDGPTE